MRESVCGMTVATSLKAQDIRSIGKIIVKGTRVPKLRLQPSSAELGSVAQWILQIHS